MKQAIKTISTLIRARRVTDIGKAKYDCAVVGCADVSRINNSLAFKVRRDGPFGNPVIEQIPRPDRVVLGETSDCVVIKDGRIYELITW